jgi:NAD(P)-dependent dehydrogenase (short-subunit alcohol dehydrogenase family)
MPKADHAAWPKPAEIAATIAFLASAENKVTTGGVVPVPGRT